MCQVMPSHGLGFLGFQVPGLPKSSYTNAFCALTALKGLLCWRMSSNFAEEQDEGEADAESRQPNQDGTAGR